DCYVAPYHYHVVSSILHANYDALVIEAKKTIARCGDRKFEIDKDPQAALNSEEFEDRLYAAQVLIRRYRTRPPLDSSLPISNWYQGATGNWFASRYENSRLSSEP